MFWVWLVLLFASFGVVIVVLDLGVYSLRGALLDGSMRSRGENHGILFGFGRFHCLFKLVLVLLF